MRSTWLVLGSCLLMVFTACGSVLATPDAGTDVDAAGPPDSAPDAERQVTSVAVTPSPIEVLTGQPVQLTAIATYQDGTTDDVTATATWESTNGSVATVAAGLVTGLATGDCDVHATFAGVRGTSTIRVRLPVMVVSNFSGNSIVFFDTGANGDAAPLRTISGNVTGLSNPRSIAVVDGELFVVNQQAGTVTVYPVTGSGNLAPLRTITGLATPSGIAIADGELFVTLQGSSVLVFPTGASGAAVPTRTLTGAATGLSQPIGAWVEGTELFLGNCTGNTVTVHATSATGNVAPLRTIGGAATGLSCPQGQYVSGSELFVVNASANEIRVFSASASGNVAPLRIIGGASPGLSFPDQLAVHGDQIFVSSYSNNSVRVFPSGAAGNIAPTRLIAGGTTGLSGNLGLLIY